MPSSIKNIATLTINAQSQPDFLQSLQNNSIGSRFQTHAASNRPDNKLLTQIALTAASTTPSQLATLPGVENVVIKTATAARQHMRVTINPYHQSAAFFREQILRLGQLHGSEIILTSNPNAVIALENYLSATPNLAKALKVNPPFIKPNSNIADAVGTAQESPETAVNCKRYGFKVACSTCLDAANLALAKLRAQDFQISNYSIENTSQTDTSLLTVILNDTGNKTTSPAKAKREIVSRPPAEPVA